jgi:hypothetical protein
MLSVILLCRSGQAESQGPRRDSERIVRSLTPLVQVAAQGLLRDVVLTGSPGGELAIIAEHAGCALAEGDDEGAALRHAIALVRADHLMIFRAGYVPEAGFFEAVEDCLGFAETRDRAQSLRAAPENFAERLFPQLAPVVGLIAKRALCQSA